MRMRFALSSAAVALLAEGVDRNTSSMTSTPSMNVALLAEGVDRNSPSPFWKLWSSRSPSSRRAWIEIHEIGVLLLREKVALLAEGVDRNLVRTVGIEPAFRRPPRGGRG